MYAHPAVGLAGVVVEADLLGLRRNCADLFDSESVRFGIIVLEVMTCGRTDTELVRLIMNNKVEGVVIITIASAVICNKVIFILRELFYGTVGVESIVTRALGIAALLCELRFVEFSLYDR